MINNTGLSPKSVIFIQKYFYELSLEGNPQTFADNKASIYTAKAAAELFRKMQWDCETLGRWQ